MAQDATGTPTAKGIPKYNTAVDAPSGKGFNAAMDVIDGLIIPDTIFDAKGDIIAATAADSPARVAVGADGLFLKADSGAAAGVSWGSAGGAGYGTALPGSPTDGDQFILVDSTSAPTYSWLLRYVSAKSSNKWIFIGGTPIQDEVATAEATSSTGSYIALATAGPSIAVPVAGDYIVTLGCTHVTATSQTTAFMSYDIGGTGAVDADGVQGSVGSGQEVSISRVKKKAGLTAVTLTAKYKSVGANGTYQERFINLLPIAIGG